MKADQTRQPVRRARQIERVDLAPGPACELRDAIFELYLRAGAPTLDELEKGIADADDLPGAPGRDVISRIVSGREVAANQHDAVAVAVALARTVGRDQATVANRVRDLWVAAKMTPPPMPPRRVGRPISECDPLDLEVHRAIAVSGLDASLEALPTYVPRAHDQLVQAVVASAAGGVSRIGVLVGGSSTGKTRACWEAIQFLSDRWWLWHPIDPSRPNAAAEALGEVGAYTVVWLNETQHYLLTPDRALGERVAAGLRTLLRDPNRSPVLILGTVWPQYWATLTTPPPAGAPDPHGQARELLAGADIPVPDTFSSTDLQALRAATVGDPRLRHAAKYAEAGRITQQLAGVPELIARYRNAPTAARAIIEVAIDARRLGHPPAIPHALLAQAAPSYMDDHGWTQAGDDWLGQALAYSAAPCQGVPGPLTRVRPRPGDADADGPPYYRLADYLEQNGRGERAFVFPPAGFWDAAGNTVTNAEVLRELAEQARSRGRFQRAARLFRRAADRGSARALGGLAVLHETAGDVLAAEKLYRQALDLGQVDALRGLVRLRERAGDWAAAEALARRAAELGDPFALSDLAQVRERAGDQAAAKALAMQAASHGDTDALVELAWAREQAGDLGGAEELYRRATKDGDTGALRELARLREQAGDRVGAEALAMQAADLGDPFTLEDLAQQWTRRRTEAQVTDALAGGDLLALVDVGRMRENVGDLPGAGMLYRLATELAGSSTAGYLAQLREDASDEAQARLAAAGGDLLGSLDLARMREQTGDVAGAELAYRLAVDRGHPFALGNLAQLLERIGDRVGAERIRRFGVLDDGTPAVSLT